MPAGPRPARSARSPSSPGPAAYTPSSSRPSIRSGAASRTARIVTRPAASRAMTAGGTGGGGPSMVASRSMPSPARPVSRWAPAGVAGASTSTARSTARVRKPSSLAVPPARRPRAGGGAQMVCCAVQGGAHMKWTTLIGASLLAFATVACGGPADEPMPEPEAEASGPSYPLFELDPNWPALPNDWVTGEVSSVTVDRRDHIWVLHRPHTVPEENREERGAAHPRVRRHGRVRQCLGRSGRGVRLALERARPVRGSQRARLDRREQTRPAAPRRRKWKTTCC